MGAAPGAPSEEGTYLDGEAALDFARNPLGIDPAQTVPFGAPSAPPLLQRWQPSSTVRR